MSRAQDLFVKRLKPYSSSCRRDTEDVCSAVLFSSWHNWYCDQAYIVQVLSKSSLSSIQSRQSPYFIPIRLYYICFVLFMEGSLIIVLCQKSSVLFLTHLVAAFGTPMMVFRSMNWVSLRRCLSSHSHPYRGKQFQTTLEVGRAFGFKSIKCRLAVLKYFDSFPYMCAHVKNFRMKDSSKLYKAPCRLPLLREFWSHRWASIIPFVAFGGKGHSIVEFSNNLLWHEIGRNS